MLTTDEIIFGYRFILGRSPSTAEVETKRGVKDITTLRTEMLNSQEFRMTTPSDETVPLGNHARAIVFQHIPKCAGTSIHNALVAATGEDVMLCPERHNGLWNYPLKALRAYNLFSGHFDRASVDCLPFEEKRLFTLLRDPTSRLISLYSYLRALKPKAAANQLRDMQLAELARKLSPEAFFSDEAIRANPSIDNAMVRALAFTLPTRSWEAHTPRIVELSRKGSSAKEGLDKAIRHLEDMDAFGLVEEMDACLPYIFSRIGLPQPENFASVNVTKTLHETSKGFEAVQSVRKTKVLKAVLAELICEDQKLYDQARRILVERGIVAQA